jgi:hypothetical protein
MGKDQKLPANIPSKKTKSCQPTFRQKTKSCQPTFRQKGTGTLGSKKDQKLPKTKSCQPTFRQKGTTKSCQPTFRQKGTGTLGSHVPKRRKVGMHFFPISSVKPI